MYNVIIVDDEELVIKSLKASVDWESCGFQVVGYAQSGEEAIREVRRHMPDVIFSDIRMPGMNGLELIKRLKDDGISAKFIVVSGLAEFALAQKAIQNGVFGYCLKPFDEMEITGYLHRIKKELDAARSLPEEDMLDLIDSDTPDANDRFMRQLYFAGIVRPGADKLRLMLSVKREKQSSPNMSCLALRIGYRKFLYVMADRVADELQPLLCSGDSGISKGIGFSRPFADLNGMNHAIVEAELGAYHYFTAVDPHLFRELPDSGDRKAAIPSLSSECNRMAYLTRLDEMLPSFANGQYDIRHAMLLYNDCISHLCRWGWDTADLYLYSFDQLADLFEDVREMVAYLKRLFVEEQAEHRFNAQPGRNQTLTAVLNYLDGHFGEDITIQGISKMFSLNANYISQLFRKELDKTFTEYLNGLRMERATALLRTTSIPINEIAEQVGYKDYFYFSKLFKKTRGVPPKSYRNEHRPSHFSIGS
ncbi:response regulator [Paenibacillus sp. GCM10012307]|uniref:Response regulator n=1 Tax=Paenibacillus roseus TaxID=2798579 RepID=A0A934J689_9BACL|nr:response regulator [Paenibacillus roseus]MBJ6361145.1 response regulator [Paenibacillus roseus]